VSDEGPRRPVVTVGDVFDDALPHSGFGSLVAILRLVAVAVVAFVAPVAGIVALLGLVLLWLFRSRIDISTVLVVYALFLVLVPSRYTVGPFAVTAAMVAGIVAMLLWGFGRVLGTLPRGAELHNGARIAVTILLLFTVFAYFARMVDPVNGLDQRNADRNLFTLVVLSGVAIAIIDGVRSRKGLNRILGALVFGAALVAFIAFLQYFQRLNISQYIRPPGFKVTGHEAFIYARDGLPRVAGTARHPIEFGLVMAAILPLAMHFARYARTLPARWGAIVASGMIAGAIPLALSRSAVLSLALVALIVIPTWSSRRRWRVLSMLAILVFALNIAAPRVLPQIAGLLASEEGTGSLRTRGNATNIAFELINEKPLFGHGFSTRVDTPVVIDNQFLISTIETGLLGLGALLLLVGTGIVVARRARHASRDPATRDLAQSLVAMIAAIALGGFGLNIVRFPMTAGVLFVGVGAAGALLRFERAALLPPEPDDDDEDTLLPALVGGG
jgi:hypothetical protein